MAHAAGPVSEHRSALLQQERRLLTDLLAALARVPAEAGDVALLQQAIADLDEIFLLVVAGEFNAGKSAFINALIGEQLLPEGVTPTTSAVNLLRYSEQPGERWLNEALVERTLSAPWLKNLTLVDTPGTNAVIRKHEEITDHFVPRSDMVLFVTSVDRPFTESERTFLERIRQWGKKVVIVLNKVDLLRSEEELNQVLTFIRENSQQLLGFTPEVFPVSARLAQEAQAAGDRTEWERLWQRSRLGALESYIATVLDDTERTRLKLLSPLGVADRLIQQYTERARGELKVLNDDNAAIESMVRQIELWTGDIEHDFKHRLNEVELIVRRMADRGEKFFDETLRLGRALDLFNADKIQAEFEREVVADTGRQVEDAVRELSDWLVTREQGIWRSVSEYLERRRNARVESMLLGDFRNEFSAERGELLGNLTRSARRSMESYDRDYEAREMALSVRTAMTQTAVAEVGAIGLGAVVAALATTAAADFTGGRLAGGPWFLHSARQTQAGQGGVPPEDRRTAHAHGGRH